ncbi:hypothetical protein AAHA92_14539 [Salvia divinorum]|uniref:Uncharacterized protein n=1 Tax=Salvia divinorum TaxID=28513 RepID=A0ABD1HEG6_SALDI
MLALSHFLFGFDQVLVTFVPSTSFYLNPYSSHQIQFSHKEVTRNGVPYIFSGAERGIYFGGPLFCARDVMADHETIRKVECYRKELTKVMLLLGEIIRNHQMNMLMIQFVVAHSRWKWFKGCLGALDGTYINATWTKSSQRLLLSL